MTDIISKVIGLLMAFALLVLAPLAINDMTDDAAAKRIALNEVESFIDKVTDKACITKFDVDDLMLGVNSGGIAFDVQIYHYSRKIYGGTSGVNSVYILADDNPNTLSAGSYVNLESGDAVQARIKAIGYTSGQSILRQFTGVISEPYSFTLSGTVR